MTMAMSDKIFVLYRCFAVTDGKIIEIEYVDNSSQRKGFAAIVEFTAQNENGRSRTILFPADELKKSLNIKSARESACATFRKILNLSKSMHSPKSASNQ